MTLRVNDLQANSIVYTDANKNLVTGSAATSRQFKMISDYDDLADAISTIGSDLTTLFIDEDTAVSGTQTLPATLDIGGFLNGAQFTGSGTLVINQMSARPGYQIFGDDLTVQFGDGAVDSVVPEWFGASGDGSTDDYTAISKLIASQGSNVATVLIKNGTFKIGTNLSIPANITLKFENATFMVPSGVTITVGGPIYADKNPFEPVSAVNCGTIRIAPTQDEKSFYAGAIDIQASTYADLTTGTQPIYQGAYGPTPNESGLQFIGLNSAGERKVFAAIQCELETITDGSEEGRMHFFTQDGDFLICVGTITKNGDWIIGPGSPTYLMDIVGLQGINGVSPVGSPIFGERLSVQEFDYEMTNSIAIRNCKPDAAVLLSRWIRAAYCASILNAAGKERPTGRLVFQYSDKTDAVETSFCYPTTLVAGRQLNGPRFQGGAILPMETEGNKDRTGHGIHNIGTENMAFLHAYLTGGMLDGAGNIIMGNNSSLRYLDGDHTTGGGSVVVASPPPDATPQTGYLRIQDDGQGYGAADPVTGLSINNDVDYDDYTTLAYSSWTGSTFTLVDTLPADFTSGNKVYIYTGNAGIGTKDAIDRLSVFGGNTADASGNILDLEDVTTGVSVDYDMGANRRYSLLKSRNRRTIDDYGGLNKRFVDLYIATPGTDTTGESDDGRIADFRIAVCNTTTGTTTVDAFTVHRSGNVGVQVILPDEPLHVGGNVKADGRIYTEDTTDATTTTDGSLQTDGGLSVAKSIVTSATSYYYFGPSGTDGSWRMGLSGNNFVIERRESSAWVTKQTITP